MCTTKREQLYERTETMKKAIPYKKTNELDLHYFISLAAREAGQTHDLMFQADSRYWEKAGTYTILGFEEEDPHFFYDRYDRDPDSNNDEPTGAMLGTFTIQLSGTKFYKNRTLRCPVIAYVQTKCDGVTDLLNIREEDLTTGKNLKAYRFPLLNSGRAN